MLSLDSRLVPKVTTLTMITYIRTTKDEKTNDMSKMTDSYQIRPGTTNQFPQRKYQTGTLKAHLD